MSRELVTPLFCLADLVVLLALLSALLICPQATNMPALSTVVTPTALMFFSQRDESHGESVANLLGRVPNSVCNES